jgi:hypothetical protein
MPRLIPPELGNGKRPSDPLHSSGGPNDSVPVLDVEDPTHEFVGATHNAALDPDDDDAGLLTGALVMLDNQRPAKGSGGNVIVHIGASSLWQATTEVIASFGAHALDMPEWVASTDPDIASVLAEHYTLDGYSTCKVIPMEEAS